MVSAELRALRERAKIVGLTQKAAREVVKIVKGKKRDAAKRKRVASQAAKLARAVTRKKKENAKFALASALSSNQIRDALANYHMYYKGGGPCKPGKVRTGPPTCRKYQLAVK